MRQDYNFMRTIIFTIVILFSFSNVQAQRAVSTETKLRKHTKIDFYKTLVAVNNFDINIKTTSKLITETKTEFYKALMIKNGFTADDKLNTRLSNNSAERRRILSDTTQITGLLP